MSEPQLFADLVESRSTQLSRSERRVATYLAANRYKALMCSAMQLANATATSDATVIRTARALGFEGLDALRAALATELSIGITPASRVARTVTEVGGDLRAALRDTIATQRTALDAIEASLDPKTFSEIVTHIVSSPATAVFGLGPSSAIGRYLGIQLQRFGIQAKMLDHTGLLLADQLLTLSPGDFLIIMAYGRLYDELDVVLAQSSRLKLANLLITDDLDEVLGRRVQHVVRIPRGKTAGFSLHAGTLAFLETVLIGVAVTRPQATLETLGTLNALRGELAGHHTHLPIPKKE